MHNKLPEDVERGDWLEDWRKIEENSFSWGPGLVEGSC